MVNTFQAAVAASLKLGPRPHSLNPQTMPESISPLAGMAPEALPPPVEQFKPAAAVQSAGGAHSTMGNPNYGVVEPSIAPQGDRGTASASL